MKQAEMVLAADPGVPGHAPRVWVYRNNIKALNWFSSVREKLGTPETGCFLSVAGPLTLRIRCATDDPKYSSWFVKFRNFSDSPYPGGAIAKPRNGSYHVLPTAVHSLGGLPFCIPCALDNRCQCATGTIMAQGPAAPASTT